MAAGTAHTSLGQISSNAPSVFDLIAQQALQDLLHPAAQHVVQAFFPSTWIKRWYNEIFLLINSTLQYLYLTKTGGTFSESFYGLKRTNISKGTFSKKDILLSILAVSLVPYLRHKLNETAEEIYFDRPTPKKWETYFTKANTCVQVSLQLIDFLLLYRYLCGKSLSYCLMLKACNLKLEYATFIEQKSPLTLKTMLPFFIQKGFEISAFFLQFHQWWQNEHHGVLIKLPVPEAPLPRPETEEIVSGLCPLCKQEWDIQTVLSVSGFVFCFSCINNYLKVHRTCPITKIPASARDLIRIYTSV